MDPKNNNKIYINVYKYFIIRFGAGNQSTDISDKQSTIGYKFNCLYLGITRLIAKAVQNYHSPWIRGFFV